MFFSGGRVAQVRLQQLCAILFPTSATYVSGFSFALQKHVARPAGTCGLRAFTARRHPRNLPRVLPVGVKAEIDLASWPVPANLQVSGQARQNDTGELLQSIHMGVA